MYGDLEQLLAPCQCYQSCSFTANLCLCFAEFAGYFEDLQAASFWVCFNFQLLVFFKLLFCELLVFDILWNIYYFNLL